MSMGKDYRGPLVDYDSVEVIADLYCDFLRSNGVSARDARTQAAIIRMAIESMPVNFRGVTAISDICRRVGLDPQEVGIVPHLNGDWCPEEWRRL